MFVKGIFVICLFCLLNSVVSINSKWNLSPFTGSQETNEVKKALVVRSLIVCVYMCTIASPECQSVQYRKENKECTLLTLTYQGKGPYTKRDDVFHFSTSEKTVCPHGYTYLNNSKTCAKLFSGSMPYLQWNTSLEACQNEGGDLPILNNDMLFAEFQEYMDITINASNRVAVNARLINNVPTWGNGVPVDSTKFCEWTPDLLNTPNVCIYMAHKSEDWCNAGASANRLDDALCSEWSLRICVIKL